MTALATGCASFGQRDTNPNDLREIAALLRGIAGCPVVASVARLWLSST